MISWLLSWYGTAEVLESQWLKGQIFKEDILIGLCDIDIVGVK